MNRAASPKKNTAGRALSPWRTAASSLVIGLAVVLAVYPSELRAEPAAPANELTVTWRRFAPVDYVATGLILGALLTVEVTMDIPSQPHFTEPVPVLDVAARHWLVGSTREDREQADKLSDVFWYFSTSLPVVDSLVTPVVRGAPFDVIWQLQLMNAQAFSVASLVARFQHRTVGRSRPNLQGCKNDPNYDVQCGTLGQLASWPSGHTAISMTGAGLSCAHHLHAKLYGNKLADALACAGPIVAANLVSYFRLRADRHWFSDNVAGALIGFSAGYGLPTLLYYQPFLRSSEPSKSRAKGSLTPRIAALPLFLGDAAYVYAVGML